MKPLGVGDVLQDITQVRPSLLSNKSSDTGVTLSACLVNSVLTKTSTTSGDSLSLWQNGSSFATGRTLRELSIEC